MIYRHAHVSIAAHVGGLALGALLITGYWHPAIVFQSFKLARIRKQVSQKKENKGAYGGKKQRDISKHDIN